jgi:hypothetical protein
LAPAQDKPSRRRPWVDASAIAATAPGKPDVLLVD